MAERSIKVLRQLVGAAEGAVELNKIGQGYLEEERDELRDELARAEARAAGTLDVYEPDPRLVAYRVILETGDEYRFWAEDAAHAREQALDAEPDAEISEVVLGQKGGLL